MTMSTERLMVEAGGPAVAREKVEEGERSEPGGTEARATAERAARPPSPAAGEVRTTRGRRTFRAEYKAAILREADACQEPGQVGALLRREGLYSSHLAQWRQQRDKAEQRALEPKKRGPKGKSEEAKQLAQLQREKARLEEELRKAKIIIEYQKKVRALLGIPLPEPPDAEDL